MSLFSSFIDRVFRRKVTKPVTLPYTSNVNLVWGSGVALETIPIVNLPIDTKRVRRRIRNNDLMFVFIKTPTAIRRYMVERCEGGIRLMYPTQQNVAWRLE